MVQPDMCADKIRPGTGDFKATLLANVEALIKTLDKRPQAALDLNTAISIRREEGRVLAVRNYLRTSKANLEERWAWSDEEIHEFKRSADPARLKAAIDQVTRGFEKANVGFTLATGQQVRPLEKQIQLWEANATVYHLGRQLIEKLLATFDQWSSDLDVFEKYLTGKGPRGQVVLEKMKIPRKKGDALKIPASPTHATPGLSAHGRATAVDFVVVDRRTNRRVTSTTTRTIRTEWDEPGWTDRLKRAVVGAGNHFEGPLHSGSLYEPWHYAYTG